VNAHSGLVRAALASASCEVSPSSSSPTAIQVSSHDPCLTLPIAVFSTRTASSPPARTRAVTSEGLRSTLSSDDDMSLPSPFFFFLVSSLSAKANPAASPASISSAAANSFSWGSTVEKAPPLSCFSSSGTTLRSSKVSRRPRRAQGKKSLFIMPELSFCRTGTTRSSPVATIP